MRSIDIYNAKARALTEGIPGFPGSSGVGRRCVCTEAVQEVARTPRVALEQAWGTFEANGRFAMIVFPALSSSRELLPSLLCLCQRRRHVV